MLSRELRLGLLAILYTLLIYLTSGMMRDIQVGVRQWLGSLFGAALTTLVVGLVVLVVGYALRKSTTIRWQVLAFVAFGYLAMLWALPVAEERVHLVQYGVLSLLVTGALVRRLEGHRLHLAVIALVILAGAGDEWVQHLRPNRVGDLRDLLINGISALLAQGLIYALGLMEGRSSSVAAAADGPDR